jgi:hypothetical protein
MRWIGEGSALWRVRVDLFADDDNGARVSAAREDLVRLLVHSDDTEVGPVSAADQGTGVEGSPVVGLLFWVSADSVGDAATLALATATQAGQSNGVGPGLYDVTGHPAECSRAAERSRVSADARLGTTPPYCRGSRQYEGVKATDAQTIAEAARVDLTMYSFDSGRARGSMPARVRS